MSNEYEMKLSDDAQNKLTELLTCGNERVELAAAKELMAIYGKATEEDDREISLDVNITIKE